MNLWATFNKLKISIFFNEHLAYNRDTDVYWANHKKKTLMLSKTLPTFGEREGIHPSDC